ncbi:MAG: hypothetical protein WCG06_03765 [Candidatus Omnitrophota bacterium]
MRLIVIKAEAECQYLTLCYNNATYAGGDASTGPLRCGIFATAISTTRTTAGAGYFGNMELSGNVYERTVSVGNTSGRAFTGTHGDGTLTTTSGYEGNATNTDWPGIDANANRGVTGALGSGLRGGCYANSATGLHLGSRNLASYTDTSRSQRYGGRVARSGPSS